MSGRHVVGLIRFDPGTNDGVLQCRCGWFGRVSAYDAHRGIGRADPDTCRHGHVGQMEEYGDPAAPFRRCRTCHRESCARSRARRRERQEVAAA